ncbi:MAG: helix-turn-helix transcriptional regulator [Planctomycetaceae bacterium]|nr:helix-turn-helix transcriptional regulator [Planctomycetaceae bacterium]
MESEPHEDPVMEAVRERLQASGKTYQEIGEAMGYSPSSARQAVSQFLKGSDPRIGTLRKFAKAMGVSVLTLLK